MNEPRRIHVYIDRITLRGFHRGEHVHLTAGLQGQLRESFSQSNAAARLVASTDRNGARVARLKQGDSGDVKETGERLGRRIGREIAR